MQAIRLWVEYGEDKMQFHMKMDTQFRRLVLPAMDYFDVPNYHDADLFVYFDDEAMPRFVNQDDTLDRPTQS